MWGCDQGKCALYRDSMRQGWGLNLLAASRGADQASWFTKRQGESKPTCAHQLCNFIGCRGQGVVYGAGSMLPRGLCSNVSGKAMEAHGPLGFGPDWPPAFWNSGQIRVAPIARLKAPDRWESWEIIRPPRSFPQYPDRSGRAIVAPVTNTPTGRPSTNPAGTAAEGNPKALPGMTGRNNSRTALPASNELTS